MRKTPPRNSKGNVALKCLLVFMRLFYQYASRYATFSRQYVPAYRISLLAINDALFLQFLPKRRVTDNKIFVETKVKNLIWVLTKVNGGGYDGYMFFRSFCV